MSNPLRVEQFSFMEAAQIALQSIVEPRVLNNLYDTVVNIFMERINYKQFIDDTSVEAWANLQASHVINVNWGANVKAVDLITDYLPETGGKILDIGCNDGAIVKKLIEMGYDSYGVDLPQVIKEAQCPDRLFICNLETDDLPDGPYDLILAFAVIEHLKNYNQLLSKIVKVLKQSGIIYLTTINREYREIDIWHTHHFTVEELSELANQAGLRLLEYKQVGSRTNITVVLGKSQ